MASVRSDLIEWQKEPRRRRSSACGWVSASSDATPDSCIARLDRRNDKVLSLALLAACPPEER